MKTLHITIKPLLLVIILISFTSFCNTTPAQSTNKVLKIGTYDSRIITLAYSRSEAFNAHLSELQKQSEADFQGNDSTKKVEAAYRMITFQYLLHQQVFCTGSASSVLHIVRDKLPQLVMEEGVEAIVSKWELTYSDPSIEIVDLTMALAKLYNPTGDFENMAAEVGKQDPIPLEEFTIEEVVQMWKMFESRYMGK